MTELSVVVPVYGCGPCLRALYGRLCASLEAITSDFELIFIDDRSEDAAWPILCGLSAQDDRVRAYRLSRNFGQDAAITAGLAFSTGRRVVVMDCDLQEAPEDIASLYAAADQGFDVVRSVRTGCRHSFVRRWTSRGYRRLVQRSRVQFGTLSLLSRRVVDILLTLDDKHREYMLTLDWLGFDQTTVKVTHHKRYAGRSSYTLRRLLRVALAGIFFRTTAMPRVVVFAGVVVVLAGGLLAGIDIHDHLAHPNTPVKPYQKLAVLIVVLTGFVIVSIGVVGIHVGRIFDQVRNRPIYVIDAEAPSAPSEPSRTPSVLRHQGVSEDSFSVKAPVST